MVQMFFFLFNQGDVLSFQMLVFGGGSNNVPTPKKMVGWMVRSEFDTSWDSPELCHCKVV